MVIALAIAVVTAVFFAIKANPDLGIELPFSIGDNSGQEGSGVSVNKKVQFSVADYYAGTVANAKTLYVYDGDTLALLDTLTTASTGLIATTANYPSGKQLYVKFVDGNSIVWYDVTVPKMNANDAEANTYNDVALKKFTIGTYTSDSLKFAATAVSDADKYNYTLSGTTPVFVYQLTNTGSDNTGLMESYDPIYNQALQVWVEIKVSGTGWETVVLSGVDRIETIGSAYYGYVHLSPTALTKWKIGNDYVAGYRGTDDLSFSLDLSGYSSNTVTVQITAYAYADPNYAVSHGGNLGTSKVEIAEQTFTLDDT